LTLVHRTARVPVLAPAASDKVLAASISSMSSHSSKRLLLVRLGAKAHAGLDLVAATMFLSRRTLLILGQRSLIVEIFQSLRKHQTTIALGYDRTKEIEGMTTHLRYSKLRKAIANFWAAHHTLMLISLVHPKRAPRYPA
jgi:hypothetical protein